MAKSTLNKALASLRFKYVDMKERFELLVDRAAKQCVELGSLRANYTMAVRLYHQLLDENKRLKESDIGGLQAQLAGLEQRVQQQTMQLSEQADYKHKQGLRLREAQNENAKLRDKLETYSSNAWVFGMLSVIAAFGFGVAFQHWFQINI